MIAEISHYLSILATALFFLTAIFSLLIKNNKYISKLSRSTFNHAFIFLACSFAIYIFMAINDEFSVRYIYSHSNSKLPVFYNGYATYKGGQLLLEIEKDSQIIFSMLLNPVSYY